MAFLKRAARMCCFFIATTTLFPAASEEPLSPESAEVGFEVMLLSRMNLLGIESAPVIYERLCDAVEKKRAEQEVVAAEHKKQEELFIGGADKVRDIERAQRDGVRQQAGVSEGLTAQLKDIMSAQKEAARVMSEAAEHLALLRQQEEVLVQHCAAAERNVALLMACREEHVDAAALAALLAAGADPNCCDTDGYTPMLLAWEGGDLPAFYQLREAGGLYLATNNDEMQQELDEELCLACDDSQLPAVEFVFSLYMGAQLPEDALPRAVLSADDITNAAQRVAVLCHEPVAIDAQDSHGQTALHYAVMRYQAAETPEDKEVAKSIIEGLCEVGADIRATNNNGKSVYEDYATAETQKLLDLQFHENRIE